MQIYIHTYYIRTYTYMHTHTHTHTRTHTTYSLTYTTHRNLINKLREGERKLRIVTHAQQCTHTHTHTHTHTNTNNWVHIYNSIESQIQKIAMKKLNHQVVLGGHENKKKEKHIDHQ